MVLAQGIRQEKISLHNRGHVENGFFMLCRGAACGLRHSAKRL